MGQKNALNYAVLAAEAKGIKKGKHKKASDITREMKKDGLLLAQI